MPKVQLWGFQCTRCGRKWLPRDIDDPPAVCPKCKSPYWDRLRQVDKTEKTRDKGRRKS
jgi:uncharacterized OB-fold protein